MKIFRLNRRETPSDRLKKFANFFLKDGKREKTEKIMRNLFTEIKKEKKENPSKYLLSSLSKIYIPVGLRREKTLVNTILIPIFTRRSTSFYRSVLPLLKEIRANKRDDKIVDRIFTGLRRLNSEDSDLVGRAKELRSEIIKNRGNIYRRKR